MLQMHIRLISFYEKWIKSYSSSEQENELLSTIRNE